MSEKRCPQCKETKPTGEFHPRSLGNGKHGFSWCKPCHSQGSRRSRLKREYGISPEEYDELLASQSGRCAICGNPESELDPRTGESRRLHVDHSHACCPGKLSCGKCIRGLLCGNCNRGLGMLQDDPARLIAAALYVGRA